MVLLFCCLVFGKVIVVRGEVALVGVAPGFEEPVPKSESDYT
jgi:hypothetical protein